MINLAAKDISHSLSKFIITALGVGMLLGIVLIMIGVYRGMISDATTLIDDIGADIWVVQEDTLGPFAEPSRLHEDFKNTLRSVNGISQTSAVTFQNLQLPHPDGRTTRVFALGYDPLGKMIPLNQKRIIEGRGLLHDHYEIVVSKKTGFILNEKIPLGRDLYTVVGITEKTVSSGGDLLVYLSLKDAQKLQFLYSNARIRTDRARGFRGTDATMVNAIVATVKTGHTPEEVAANIRRWKHKGIFTNEGQKEILTGNLIKMASKQIGMFTAILLLVSVVIIAMIIYNMTVEKIKEIAVMKLIGIPNGLIIKMIVQETLLLGVLSFLSGVGFSHLIYTKFPKNVVLQPEDAVKLFAVILVASLLASLFGAKKAIDADPTSAIGG
ncbi:MAG TPA: ABC transporter permease [Sulfurovum sp.]|nr:ABC transporter permease [Sulfurovum sp.]